MSVAAQVGSQAGWASARTARLYDSQLALERTALRAALELAAPAADELVLDLGTGTGALLRMLAQRPGRPSRAIGIDASSAMLSHVPTLPEGWRLINADARSVPLGDSSVDVVTCAYLLHVLEEPALRAVLAEIARVLRPRGRAVTVTLLEPRGLLGGSLLAPVQHALCRVLGRRSGWCDLDPARELVGAGLLVRGRRVCTRGYASLCLLAERG
ncbi:MAG: class I SAM-dependent methyltransferase [Actinomycetota bacterium]|nr:class I SAM-dependent methyltransferase [Actinomycetota bacterium]